MPPPLSAPPPLEDDRRAMRSTMLKLLVGGVGGVLVLGMLFSLIPDSKPPEPEQVARDTRSTPERYKDRLDSAQASGDTARATEFATRLMRDYPSSLEADTARLLRPDLVPSVSETLRREKEVRDRQRERASEEAELSASSQADTAPQTYLTTKDELALVSMRTKNERYITYITGEIQNISGENLRYAQVQFNILDNSGAQIGTAMDNISSLAAGRTWRYKAAVLGLDEGQSFRYEYADMSAF